jgi:hypothetical protein
MRAASSAAHSTFQPADDLCFASGSATYKLSQKAAAPDIRVKFDNFAPRPDLRMELVDRPEIADFVLADDFGAPPSNACRSSVRVKVVKIELENGRRCRYVLSADSRGRPIVSCGGSPAPSCGGRSSCWARS